MVGDNSHSLCVLAAVVVLFPADTLELGNYGQEYIRLVAVGKSVEEQKHSVEAEARIYVLVFKGVVTALRLFVLHIHVVADFHVVVGEYGIFLVGVERVEPLVIGAAGGADGALQFPPVVRFGKVIDVFGFDTQTYQKVSRFLVAGGGIVALEHGGTQLVLIQPENFG